MAGPGTIVAIDVRGGATTAERVCDAVRLWVHATSLGGVESCLERRRRWPAEQPDVPETLLRLSVGIEDVEDLWDDLAAALDQARHRAGSHSGGELRPPPWALAAMNAGASAAGTCRGGPPGRPAR